MSIDLSNISRRIATIPLKEVPFVRLRNDIAVKAAVGQENSTSSLLFLLKLRIFFEKPFTRFTTTRVIFTANRFLDFAGCLDKKWSPTDGEFDR